MLKRQNININSSILQNEVTLTKFVDNIKVSVPADNLLGRETMQSDLHGLGRWAHANFMKFCKAKCKVLCMGQGSSKHQYRLTDRWIECSSAALQRRT